MRNRRAVIGGAAAAFFLSALDRAAASPTARDQLLRAAFLFGFPIFEFARTAREAVRNAFDHRSALADHTFRAITTPNNDTIYSSARFDISNGPALVDIPSVSDRYFSVVFMNAFTDNFASVGTRATKGVGGRFLLAGPRWRGSPPEGASVIASASDDVWALGRFAVSGPEDLGGAVAAQSGLAVAGAPRPTLLALTPTRAEDSANFIGVVNAMLKRIDKQHPAMRAARAYREVGIGKPSIMDSGLQAAWTSAIPPLLEELAGSFGRNEAFNGWRYSSLEIGSERASDFVRAATALSGLAALTREEAVYVACRSDSAGLPLSGERAYRLPLPAEIPCDAFWSLSLYALERDGRMFFAENPINRFSIGDRTPGLKRNPSGGVDIVISTRASDAANANWLPAPPGAICLVFRAYLPRPEFGAWKLPAVEALAS